MHQGKRMNCPVEMEVEPQSLDVARLLRAGPGAGCRRQVFEAGQRVHAAGQPGSGERVLRGAVRLERVAADGSREFAGLAVRGDVFGAETLTSGHYGFDAFALVDAELGCWSHPARLPAAPALALALDGLERRAADALALRSGAPVERVRRLILMLADGGVVPIPPLKDIGAITGLAGETVCRALAALKRNGDLRRSGPKLGEVRRGLRREVGARAPRAASVPARAELSA